MSPKVNCSVWKLEENRKLKVFLLKCSYCIYNYLIVSFVGTYLDVCREVQER